MSDSPRRRERAQSPSSARRRRDARGSYRDDERAQARDRSPERKRRRSVDEQEEQSGRQRMRRRRRSASPDEVPARDETGRRACERRERLNYSSRYRGHDGHHRHDEEDNSRKSHHGHDNEDHRRQNHHRHNHDDHRHHRHHHHQRAEQVMPRELPFSARPLSKSDLATFEPLFVHYLSVQKQREARDMDSRELRGRWRSFVGKWNRGELAEGWYDPDMFTRIAAWAEEEEEEYGEGNYGTRGDDEGRGDDPGSVSRGTTSARHDRDRDGRYDEDDDEDGEDEDEDDYGPTLPQPHEAPRRKQGAGIPTVQDLTVRDELIRESREQDVEALRSARRAERALQRDRLEELAPRAEPGTRERRLEKRREAGERAREYRRDRSPGMDDSAATDAQLYSGGGGGGGGGGPDSLEELKQIKARERRRKSEREVRREELERAKREMMEARRRQWQEREEGTVSMLRELARQRFG